MKRLFTFIGCLLLVWAGASAQEEKMDENTSKLLGNVLSLNAEQDENLLATILAAVAESQNNQTVEDPMKYVVPLPDGVSRETYTYAVKGTDTLKLDYYRIPGDIRKRPTIIFSFGGGWAGGERQVFKHVGRFVKHGINAVAIDYRLGMKDKQGVDSTWFGYYYSRAITMAVEDLYDATKFLMDKQDELGVDTDKIIVSGGSAGATNSIMAEYWLCNDDPIALMHLPKGFHYAGVIPCAGGVWKIGMDTPQWKRTPAPHLFMHGTADWVVPFKGHAIAASNFGAWGAADLVEIFKEKGYAYESFFLEDADHTMAAAPLFGLGKRMVDQTEHMLDFIDRIVLDSDPIQVDYYEKDYDMPRNFLTLFTVAAKDQDTEDRTYMLPPFGQGKMKTEKVKTGGVTLTITRDASFTEKMPVFIYNGAHEAFLDKLLAKGYVVVTVDTDAAGLSKVVSHMGKKASRYGANPAQIVLGGKDALAAATALKVAGVVSCGENPSLVSGLEIPVLYFGRGAANNKVWDGLEAAKRIFMVYDTPEGSAIEDRGQIVTAFIERCIQNGEVFSAKITECPSTR